MKKSLFLFAIVALFLTSCNTGEIKNEMSFSKHMAIRAIVVGTGTITTSSSTFVYNMDLVSLKMDIKMKDVQLSPEMKKTTLELKGVKFKVTKDGFEIKEESIIPFVEGVADPKYILKDVSGLVFFFTGNDAQLKFDYTIENMYDVRSTSEDPVYYITKTTVRDSENPTKPFTTETSLYNIDFDIAKMTADIKIANAKFADKMPAMNITIPGVPVVATRSGFNLSIESVIPQIGKDPYPKYIIKNLSGIMAGKTLLLNYNCASKYDVSVEAMMYPDKKEE